MTTIDEGCVGCGLCGTLAQVAALCPSFYRVEVVSHASGWERFLARLRGSLVSALLPEGA